MKDSSTLKNYNTKLKRLNNELEGLKKNSSHINKDIVKKKREIEGLKKRINNLGKANVIVSEHAILRYLERIEGINIDGVIKTILSNNKLEETIKVLTSGDIPIQGGIARVQNNVIITILSDQNK